MIDEQQQHPQQLELAAVAVACFWLLLRRTQQQAGWPLRWGCLRACLAWAALRCDASCCFIVCRPQALCQYTLYAYPLNHSPSPLPLVLCLLNPPRLRQLKPVPAAAGASQPAAAAGPHAAAPHARAAAGSSGGGSSCRGSSSRGSSARGAAARPHAQQRPAGGLAGWACQALFQQQLSLAVCLACLMWHCMQIASLLSSRLTSRPPISFGGAQCAG